VSSINTINAMPPKLALILCICGIIGLFAADLRRNERFSPGFWIALLWVLYCGSRPLSYWFDPGNAAGLDGADGSAIDRAFLSLLMLAGLMVLIRRRANWPQILSDNRWLFALFAYMAISAVWSDYPGISLKRWVRTCGDLIVALLVLTDADPAAAFRAAFRRGAYILLPLSVVLIKYFRDIGVAYTEDGGMTMWVGVTTHKNVLGYVAMVCGLVALDGILAGWKKKVPRAELLILALSVWLLLGSASASSKTSFITFCLGAVLLMVLRFTVQNSRELLGALPAAMLLFVVLAYFAWEFSDSLLAAAVQASGRDLTLTGRTDIWSAVLEIGPGNPIFGRAYGSFWLGDRAMKLFDRFFVGLHQSHNGYIDIYLELGVTGLCLLAGVVASAFSTINKRLLSGSEHDLLRIVLFLLILIHNITESSYGRPNHLLWFLFLLVSINISSLRPTPALPAAQGAQVPLQASTSNTASPRGMANPTRHRRR
jgi:exopolysaccharide production protein ExoQ